jgi:mono/diheme cytochrome c family protein
VKTPDDRFYNPAKINFWFVIGSLLTLVGMAGALVQDHFHRDWKKFQDGFFAMEKEQAEELAALRNVTLEGESEEVRALALTLVRAGGSADGAILETKAYKEILEARRRDAAFPRAAALAARLYEAEAAARASAQTLIEFDSGRRQATMSQETERLRTAIVDAENARLRAEIDQRAVQGFVDERRSQMEHAKNVGHVEEGRILEEKWKALVASEAEIHAVMDARKLDRDNASIELKKVRKDVSALEDRAASLWELSGVAGAERKVASFFLKGLRDAPGLDIAAPVRKIDQVVIPELTQDYNFSKNPRIDRCVTCHKGIDKVRVDSVTNAVTPLYTEENTPEAVYRTHPRPELFVSSVSPHSLTKVGCTVCHGGQGMALTFTDAYHTPSSPEQEKEWEEKYHWHKGHSWDYPMLPQTYIEAACVQCHGDPSSRDSQFKFAKDIPAAPQWNRGKALVERSGCFGCHKIDGYLVPGLDKELNASPHATKQDLQRLAEAQVVSMPKTGPALPRIASKFPDRETAFKWIWDPRSLRPTSNMPRFFGQPNNSGVDPVSNVDYDLRTRAEVWGIVEYLWRNSEPWQVPAPSASGDAIRGRDLVGSIGCLSCHSLNDFSAPEGVKGNDFGPDLSTVGSKASRAWIESWVRNPGHYWDGTKMPSLRLTAAEAADVAAYLSGLRNPEWEAATLPAPAEAAVRQLAMEAARVGVRVTRDPEPMRVGENPEPIVDAATPEDRLYMVGKRAIQRYGCFSCHDIPGMEGQERIGTALGGGEGWGSKDVDRLVFGMMHASKSLSLLAKDWGMGHLDDYVKRGAALPHRKPEWARLKLLNPRVFDGGMTKKPLERLVMPNFGFTTDEADAVVTYLLSLQKWEIPVTKRPALDSSTLQAERLKWIAARNNCYGCHTISRHEVILEDGSREWTMRGGDIRPWIEDQAQWPPVLGGAKRRVFVPGGGTPPQVRPWSRDDEAEGEGFKVHADWLHTFLRDPGKQVLRPYLKVRMPTYGLTEAELNSVVSGFASKDRVPFPFTTEVEPELTEAERNEAKSLFGQIGCTACHVAGSLGKPELGATAPDLLLGKGRLRRDWLIKWFDLPAGLQPGTSMPGIYRSGEDENVLTVPAGLTGTHFGDDPHRQIEKLSDLVLDLHRERAPAK